MTCVFILQSKLAPYRSYVFSPGISHVRHPDTPHSFWVPMDIYDSKLDRTLDRGIAIPYRT